ncbi:uncharacterized protein MONOS_8993 [Monocercomonoides exilis]|uniref:uncharacterized protein n=1 Tax=Monocercomonoides exilis TaxID=2049356 RepID=UPI00355ACC26|nr:hypothetical protein MONOS_8993 [Monocercomonoides exilis]|eukprot:MONOS_8993.1-p1 / transcript=MONOS_8993.1 / gene=MONOS_8993 / organism=Monocercomonoides_exilis_PA203 / gene_product=unspecified product / transcript_product=unspecified product / location=Mono_scaffold00356:13801-14102(+) / protein_length=72 / sequence_SO=supercontig / SO=protein_coding / is_pseudo=false
MPLSPRALQTLYGYAVALSATLSVSQVKPHLSLVVLVVSTIHCPTGVPIRAVEECDGDDGRRIDNMRSCRE